MAEQIEYKAALNRAVDAFADVDENHDITKTTQEIKAKIDNFDQIKRDFDNFVNQMKQKLSQ